MKKLLAMLLCISMLMSAMVFTTVFADETETTEPAEYTIRAIYRSSNELQHPTVSIKGGVNESGRYHFDDGVYYTCIYLFDKYNESSIQYNLLKGDLKYKNVYSNQKWIKPGYYDVHFFCTAFRSNNDKNATVTVYHNGETTTFKMNQTSYDSQTWNLVSDTKAPLYFSGSGDEYIKITRSNTSVWLDAGAIKIVENLDFSAEEPVEEPEAAIEEKPLITDVKYENGKITLVTNGSTIEKSKTVFAAVAAYDKDTLAGLKKTTITIEPKSGDATIPLNVPKVTSAEYKVYIFADNNIDTYNF